MSGPTQWFLGVDVGGTFTDVVLADGTGDIHIRKVPTTPDDPRLGVVDGVVQALQDATVAPGAVSRFVHGTTLATNVILQRSGGPVALVTTEGFADLLRLGRDARVEEDRYDLFFTPADPPVDSRLTFEVRERVDASGTALVAPTTGDIAKVVARVAASAPTGVAICFLHSYACPDHEQEVAAALRAAMPGAHVVCSSDVWPEMREYERAMTTVVSALVGPVMSAYLASLGTHLRDLGIVCPLEIMDSAGDVMRVARAAALPVATVESGGAAGVIAAGIVGSAVGADDVISFDMGGTTAKAGIVRHGRPTVAYDFRVGGKGSFGGARAGTGIPLKLPVVDLAEVGAGGGSIASVDAGIVRVGPRSAGAVPGPACYGHGGTVPTVTDADLVLGYLDPGRLAGGIELSVSLACGAIDDGVAAPLGIDTADAARAVYEIVNANMAGAIRVVTVQRGVDPRDFALVGFGGAGPMHVARLADDFGIRTVVVPWGAGVASAVGLVSADLAAEYHRPFVADLDRVDPDELADTFAELQRRARAEAGDGDDDDALAVSRSVAMRVRGQAHALDVAMPDGPVGVACGGLRAAFTERSLAVYGVPPTAELQLTAARVRAVRVVPKHAPTASDVALRSRPATPAGERSAHFPELGGFVTTPVFQWADLEPGARITGPAIIEGTDTTVVVLPDRAASVDRWRNVVLSR